MSLDGIEITEDAAQALGKTLQASKSIKFLQLINCKMSPPALREILTALPGTGLTGLELTGMPLGSD